MDKIKILQNELTRVEKLKFSDNSELDAIKKKLHLLASKYFGIASKYIIDINRASFHSMVHPTSRDNELKIWEDGRAKLRNVIITMIEEIKLFSDEDTNTNENTKTEKSESLVRKIFIVHGHDEAMKQAVARIVEKMDFEAIILHEQANRNRTIIEKFSDYSDVGFAIVLLSADDIGGKIGEAEIMKSRARQNVVFEMGYFIGKLGRERVAILHPSVNDFEMPSDYSGVIYLDYDIKGTWKFELARELKECGYSVDLNSLI